MESCEGASKANQAILDRESDVKALMAELCKQFYGLGWVSGTGGGISIRDGDRIFVAPSGVQKERMKAEDMFELDAQGCVVNTPANSSLKPSACSPLFMQAYTLRNAGAVIHSHSMNAMLATLIYDKEFRVTHLEMIKGIQGHGFFDTLVVPIIENTAFEEELADSLGEAIKAYPQSFAVLVRRHGVYVWGKSWMQAKAHAETLDYLFEAAVKMRQLGFDASAMPLNNFAPAEKKRKVNEIEETPQQE
eukprot:TRINITY_DN20008_c0_g1_i1.p1 TRINITY_DN20008_c0_g1~~TRINITY_DN20008_c0_g1_i1.p1  ORF type:complete len:248 (+),score=64.95 TRINITY_DN20008_c0_g1_i1:60-803(+)